MNIKFLEKFKNKGNADAAGGTDGKDAAVKSRGGRKKKLTKKKIIIIAVILIALIGVNAYIIRSKTASTESEVDSNNIGTVMRGTISNELTSSGTLSPKDTYTITSLVEGEILTADFEEGDQVEEGQVLYEIDQSDITTDIDNAQRSLTTAQSDYESAKVTYDEAISQLGGGTYRSTESGYVKNLTLKEGDTVGGNGGTKIADIYNDSAMTVRLAFLNTDADALSVGQDIVVELSDTGEQIPGRVEDKSDLLETLEGGTLVKYVKILVSNPGGLTETDRATAYAGDIHSVGDGTFTAYVTQDLNVETPSSVKVAEVLVEEGQYVTSGTALFTMTSDSYEDALRSAQKTFDSAETSLKKAENEITKLDETIDRYTITAPISGQVITKSMKAGDKITTSGSNSNNSSLALIYDLSELTFEMSIDELDISNVSVGQEVTVTADAFDDKTYKGHVTNVGLNGTASNGVTTYPVVVTMDESDGLLPGMNVDGVIKLEESTDTLYIPANALQRGNVVYVKDDSLSSANTTESADTGRPAGRPDGDESGNAAEGSMSEGDNAGGAPGDASGSGAPDENASGTGAQSGDASGTGSTDTGSAGTGSTSAAAALRQDAPTGFTAVTVETGIISDDYVEILSGLEEGQQVYVKDAVVSDTMMMGGMGGMGGGPGGNMGGGGGGTPGGGGGGGRP